MSRHFLEGFALFTVVAALAACGSDHDKGAAGPDAGSGGHAAAGGAASGGTSAGGRASTGGRIGGAGGHGDNSGGATGEGGASSSGGATATGGKPATNLPPPDPSCGLPDAAFCDAFTQASPGGRAGALDDSKWSMARLGFGCAYTFSFPETPINLCGVWKTVPPDGSDSQFCVNEDNEPRWTEGFDDNTDFNYLSARIRQPFDFEGRTGTIQWEADARTSGSHGWWTETWLTSNPVPGPLLHDPDQLVTSKEALGIVFDNDCGVPAEGKGTAGGGMVGVSRILLVHDYAFEHTYDPFKGVNDRCVKTEQGAMNRFHVKVGNGRVEVWASDAGSTELRRIAEADVDLGFTRGYVNFSHVHYNAHKAGVTTFQSYQWAKIAFDGPQVGTPRAYEIANPLSKTASSCADKQVYRMAYGVTDNVVFDIATGPSTPLALKFRGVDVSGATAARLNFNTTFVASGDTLRYRLNGGTWREYEMPAAYVTTWERQGFSVPVPASDLVNGDNTVEFGTDSNPGFVVPKNSMQIANIDLEIEAE